MRQFVLIVALFIITGCSSGVDALVPDSYQSNETNTGYLTGSLGVTTSWPSTGEGLKTTIFIRKVGKDDAIVLNSSTSASHYQTEWEKGHIFSLPLPEGEYELYCIAFTGNNGINKVYSKTSDDLGLRFNIAANEVTYIGQFLTSSLVAKSQLWNTNYPSGFGMVQHDYANMRDRMLQNEHYPDLKPLPFIPTTLKGLNDSRIVASNIE
ncbi:hypothetical protein C9I98_08505 [Photobacterium sanctipauli]|uniref:DUF2846 domain-containing protein n=1 Tax=Photobacterium sanctipauli TaxID=1342794 RepID=A0A2T3NV19_9GAMM|nr:hypothetical protein [Photobacterium sanctipauli]PSW20092.1 hypothetical protein C9I98_08505 [Photobacterium sanctipauli]